MENFYHKYYNFKYKQVYQNTSSIILQNSDT